jgi:hypothetical protein
LLAAALVSGTFGIAGAAIAAGDYSAPAKQPGTTTTAPAADAGKAGMPPATTAAPAPGATDAVKPIAPGKSETADAAFKKLDTAGGYVTQDEAKTLSGFDKAFQENDESRRPVVATSSRGLIVGSGNKAGRPASRRWRER